MVLLGPVAISALLVRWFPERRGLMIGIAGSGAAVGGLIYPPVMQLLIEDYGWRTTLQLFSLFTFLLLAPLIWFRIVDRPENTGADTAENDSKESTSESTSEASKEAAKSVAGDSVEALTTLNLFTQVRFWAVAISLCLIFAASTAISSNLLQFALEKNIQPADAAFLLSILAASGFFGKLACAAFVDKTDGRVFFALILLGLATGIYGLIQQD